MTIQTILGVGVAVAFTPIFVYMLAKIIFYAYFSAKTEYQIQLFKHIDRTP